MKSERESERDGRETEREEETQEEVGWYKVQGEVNIRLASQEGRLLT